MPLEPKAVEHVQLRIEVRLVVVAADDRAGIVVAAEAAAAVVVVEIVMEAGEAQSTR